MTHHFPILLRLLLPVLLIGFLGASEGLLAADEGKKKKSLASAKTQANLKKKKNDPATPLTKAELRMDRFSRLPVGASSLGIVRPVYKNTIISSLMTAGVITRVDEQTIRIDDLVITLYSEIVPDQVERVVTMKVAFYHIPAKEGDGDVLTSPTPSMIEVVGKYHIVGESVIYDPGKGLARMDGAVRAVFDYKAMKSPEEENKEKGNGGKESSANGKDVKNGEKAIEPGSGGGDPVSTGSTGSATGNSESRGSGTRLSTKRP